MKVYKSHPDKLLSEHLRGVVEGARRRTLRQPYLKASEIAALFHDLGKINPNFQRKLLGEKNVGYSSHAYLSALAWLCYCRANKASLPDLVGDDPSLIFSIAAMIARHHSDLSNLEEGFFKEREQDALRAFLEQTSADELPISEFLQELCEHESLQGFCADESFSVKLPAEHLEHLIYKFPLGFQHVQERITDPLDFFMNTQFGFACLLEADKRDAGYNAQFNKETFGEYIKDNFAAKLESKLQSYKAASELDALRTEMREQAVKNIRPELAKGNRIFTLSAPTGAGKTMMLLSLAAEIKRHDANLSIIYALPFLSITEQTEAICREIYRDNPDAILRIDSKAENNRLEHIQQQLDANPSEEKLHELMRESFSENTFDHPFIITTFVQLFETLVSNRNATLLRLPNFARTIFLLDEIQALPPRLYTFFTAYLDEFCRKFDSYAVISTATMPYVEMPDKNISEDKNDENPRLLFKRYTKPNELLERRFYQHDVFNRYRITPINNTNFYALDLTDEVSRQSKSCLVILNTVDDAKQLHKSLSGEDAGETSEGEFVLLSTHFTPYDRQRKIQLCKGRLQAGERVVLISTQLIEAGVDIDFPALYRDMCPLPNLIQSAGRCNRNGKEPSGDVFLFELKKENGTPSASLIYRNEPAWFLASTKRYVTGVISEKELFAAQQKFFKDVGNNLEIGRYTHVDCNFNMVQCINHARFADMGRFRLINEKEFGLELRYYIPRSASDDAFERLLKLTDKSNQKTWDFSEAKHRQMKIDSQLRSMSSRILSLRLSENKQHLAPEYNHDDETLGIRKLLSPEENYSPITGIKLRGTGGCII